eukprot:Sdes_comp17314_c0_seq2m6522
MPKQKTNSIEEEASESPSSNLSTKKIKSAHNFETKYTAPNQFLELRGEWGILWDPNSQCYYYQNLALGLTQWEAPPEFSDYFEPVVTAENGVEEGSEKRHDYFYRKFYEYTPVMTREESLKKPARIQALEGGAARKTHTRQEGQNEYNIWYDKWCGEQWKTGLSGPAETKCNIITDSGHTKANILSTSTGARYYFCIHFARGCCQLGPECTYFHRLPDDEDELANKNDYSHDVFGRERFAQHREDRGGVGSFLDPAGGKTLYIGRLGTNHTTSLEEILLKEFSEFGEIENINVISRKNIAFIRFKNRLNAEFAKAAMSDQKIDGKEVINVRWANVDPNPKAAQEKQLDDRVDFLQGAVKKGILKPEDILSEEAGLDQPTLELYQIQTNRSFLNPSNGPLSKQDLENQRKLKEAQESVDRLDKIFSRPSSFAK